MTKKRSPRRTNACAHGRPSTKVASPNVPTTEVPTTEVPASEGKSPSISRPSVPTLIEVIIDETGSMGTYIGGTLSGFNTFLDDQKAQPGEARLTLTKFSTRNVITPYQDLDISMVVPLSVQTFLPGGCTNLYDTIGGRIDTIKTRVQSWSVQPQVLVMVLTDGADNASRLYKPDVIREMVVENTRAGWSFHFLGAHDGARAVAESIGFRPENIEEFDGARMHQTLEAFSARTTAFRAGPAAAHT